MPFPTPPPSSPIAKYSFTSRDQPPPSPPEDFTISPIFPPWMPERDGSPRSPPMKHTNDINTAELGDSKSTISSYKTARASPSLESPSAAYGPFTPTKLFTHDSSENLLSLREALAMKIDDPATDDSTQYSDDQAEDRDFAVALLNKIGEGWGGGIQNGKKVGNSKAPVVADSKRDWNEYDISTAEKVDSEYIPASPTHTHSLGSLIEDYFPTSLTSSFTPKPSTAAYNPCRCAHDRASKILLVGISGAPADGRKITLDILRAVFSVTDIVSQDDYQIALRKPAPCETKVSAIAKRGEEPPSLVATKYKFDITKLTRRLTDIKAGRNTGADSHNPQDQLNDHYTAPHESEKAALIPALHALSLTLGSTAHDRIAIVEGPYLYSSPLISSLIDVRLQLLEREFLPWEDSFGTWYLQDSSSPLSGVGWGRQVLETAVWRGTESDYHTRLRTTGELARDLDIGAEGPPVPAYEHVDERLGRWGVRCVAEGMGKRKLQMLPKTEAREVKGSATRQRDKRKKRPRETEGDGQGCWGRFMKWSCVLLGAGVVSRVLVGKLWRR